MDEEPQIVRPRLIDYFGITKSQSELSFAIPFLHEDIPLYLDPFLLWKSPSQQDQALHTSVIDGFNALGRMALKGDKTEAIHRLCAVSECDEIGLGSSAKRKGKKIGAKKAEELLGLFEKLPNFSKFECNHIEETQLYIDNISKDRISDITCNFIKSFLIDYTVNECNKLKIPVKKFELNNIWSTRDRKFVDNFKAELPFNPHDEAPILFSPKRWLRFTPWINFDDYFTSACPQDDVAHKGEVLERVEVLDFNIANYGIVETYIKSKELKAEDCASDPLFLQLPVVSANRKLKTLKKIPTGKDLGADKDYERLMEELLPSLLYPHLDFATAQSRTISGSSIRDLVFYNNRSYPFLDELYKDYDTRQLVLELKNVKEVEGGHIDQLSRYLAPQTSRFGIIVTRNKLTKARLQQTVDLWSAHRKVIIILDDADIELMVQVFESKQRSPIEIIKKKYFEFKQQCPV